MPASDEFPRGLTQVASRLGAGGLLTITFAAATGLAWVLTDVQQVFAMTAGSSQDIQSWVDVSGAATANKLIYLENWFDVGVTNSMSGSWSGQLIGAVSQALTLTVNGTQSGNGNEQLAAAAYPI